MDATNFAYWLQGFLELASPEILTKEQIQIIRDHLNLVIPKVTPMRTLEPSMPFHPRPPPTSVPGPGVTPYETKIC